MSHATRVRFPGGDPVDAAVAVALRQPRYEIIPLDGAREVVSGLGADVALTVTASVSLGLDRTVALAVELAGRGHRVTPHLPARLVPDPASLAGVVDRLSGAGVRDVFVVGGDARRPAGPYACALDLLRALDALGAPFEEVGIAGYPEGHPHIDDDVLVQAMWDKRAYATYVVSQMCFDPARIRAWVDRVRRRTVTLPIEVGVPGPVPLSRLMRVSAKVGVGESTRFLRGHRGMLRSLAGPRAFRPDRLVAELAPLLAREERGVRGLHVYTFNETSRTEEWRRSRLPGAVAA
jgi:methylenetetrahydrofolate reductase (NADPH)